MDYLIEDQEALLDARSESEHNRSSPESEEARPPPPRRDFGNVVVAFVKQLCCGCFLITYEEDGSDGEQVSPAGTESSSTRLGSNNGYAGDVDTETSSGSTNSEDCYILMEYLQRQIPQLDGANDDVSASSSHSSVSLPFENMPYSYIPYPPWEPGDEPNFPYQVRMPFGDLLLFALFLARFMRLRVSSRLTFCYSSSHHVEMSTSARLTKST